MEPHLEGGEEHAFLAMELASLARASLRGWNNLVPPRSVQFSRAGPSQPSPLGPSPRGSPGLALPPVPSCPTSKCILRGVARWQCWWENEDGKDHGGLASMR